MLEVNACWCGAEAREAFSSEYDRCRGCGGLLFSRPIDLAAYTSAADDNSFYGARYWEHHVPEVLGLPGLAERAHADLAERDIHYLERLLRYLEPGADVLELGCAPGSLAFLVQQAGFGVTGLEMGGEIVEFVRRRFGVDVVEGPIERAGLQQTYDGVFMIDVLEHLPRPLSTLRACAERLHDAGALIVQTPCFRDQGNDWPMLLPHEHLFLYTEDSVAKLLETAGFNVIELGTSLFPHDMWIVAALQPSLRARPDPLDGVAPLARAMIELYGRTANRETTVAALTTACAHKDRVIDGMTEQLHSLTADLEAVRADQRDKEALIARLSDELAALRADQADKEALVARISDELASLRADQRDKEALIARMSDELAALRADQADKEALIVRISEELAEVRADQAAKEELIARLSQPAP
jgi:SAM-dependent methyltransferase